MSDGQCRASKTVEAVLPEAASPEVPAAEGKGDKSYKSPVRLRKPDRSQVKMRFCCEDELIPQGHQARVIWSVVQTLDLSEFYEPIQAREGVCGRDATDPMLLVSLWLYATTRRRRLGPLACDAVRGGDRLEQAVPDPWLCGGVSVNHHTLGDFRVGHAQALDKLFTEVIATLADNLS